MTNRARSLGASTAALLVAALVIVAQPGVSEAAQSCGTSSGYSICLEAPTGVLTGDVTISMTVNGSTTGITAVDFSWGATSTNSTQLLSDFEAPYTFVWRTDRYLDTTQWLNVRIEKNGGAPGTPVALQLTIQNGNTTGVPQNPTDWSQLFVPRASAGDPVVAAVGDGGDGTARSGEVAASIQASEASVLLYLGDIYWRGTPAEWDYNYGRASFESGARDWGTMARWTVPTLGNHEGYNIPAWRDYWHGRPNWDTFVYGGVRFLDLNSECTRIGGCGTTSAQYLFVQSTLASNTLPCVVAFWHKPVLSAVADTPTMAPIWALLANNGGDLVLNGHTHTMQSYYPMNANLQTSQPDSHMVELVSGAAKKTLAAAIDTDPRNAWQAAKANGVAYITLVGGGNGSATNLTWEMRNQNGALVPGSQSSVSCGADTQAPTVPGKPSGTSTQTGSIDLAWDASTDDLASTLTYHVYRDGDPTPVGIVASSSTTTVSFTDTGLAPSSVHTYQVDASDGPNTSGLSTASDPIVVVDTPPPATVFTDSFDSGLAGWTSVTNLALDNTNFPPSGSAPSVRVSVSGQKGFAYHDLGASYASLCMSADMNVSSIGNNTVALMKLRTASNVSIGRLFIDANRILKVRGDISGAVFSSGVALPSGWSTLELCGSVGTSGTWTLSRDGVQIGSWTTNNGTNPITRLQIGDEAAKTITANYDDVVATH